MISASLFETFGLKTTLWRATLYQWNHDKEEKICDIVSTWGYNYTCRPGLNDTTSNRKTYKGSFSFLFPPIWNVLRIPNYKQAIFNEFLSVYRYYCCWHKISLIGLFFWKCTDYKMFNILEIFCYFNPNHKS